MLQHIQRETEEKEAQTTETRDTLPCGLGAQRASSRTEYWPRDSKWTEFALNGGEPKRFCV